MGKHTLPSEQNCQRTRGESVWGPEFRPALAQASQPAAHYLVLDVDTQPAVQVESAQSSGLSEVWRPPHRQLQDGFQICL